MDPMHQKLAPIETHWPMTDEQVQKAIEVANEEARTFEIKYRRRLLLCTGVCVVAATCSIPAFLLGDKITSYGSWIGNALLLLAFVLLLVIPHVSDAIEANDTKLKRLHLSYRILNANEVSAVAEAAEHSPEIAAILQSWLDAGLLLRGVEYDLITSSEDAYRAHLSEASTRNAIAGISRSVTF